MNEAIVENPRLPVRRPEALLAELLREVPSEVAILRHPPRAPEAEDEERDGDGDGPVDPEVFAKVVGLLGAAAAPLFVFAVRPEPVEH